MFESEIELYAKLKFDLFINMSLSECFELIAKSDYSIRRLILARRLNEIEAEDYKHNFYCYKARSLFLTHQIEKHSGFLYDKYKKTDAFFGNLSYSEEKIGLKEFPIPMFAIASTLIKSKRKDFDKFEITKREIKLNDFLTRIATHVHDITTKAPISEDKLLLEDLNSKLVRFCDEQIIHEVDNQIPTKKISVREIDEIIDDYVSIKKRSKNITSITINELLLKRLNAAFQREEDQRKLEQERKNKQVKK